MQVWEVDKKLLQQHALPTVEAYGYTTETLLRALDMDEFLPGPVGAPAILLGGPRVSRRAIRAGRCHEGSLHVTPEAIQLGILVMSAEFLPSAELTVVWQGAILKL